MPAALTRARNSPISAAGSGRPRHWLAFLAKICSALQRWTTARSTARGSPPATDMCAPSRGKCLSSEPFLDHLSVRIEADGRGERHGSRAALLELRHAADEPHV